MSIFSSVKNKLVKALMATTIVGSVATTPVMAEEDKTAVDFNGDISTQVSNQTVFMPSDDGIGTERITTKWVEGSAELGLNFMNTKLMGQFQSGEESGLYTQGIGEGAQGFFQDSSHTFTDVSLGIEVAANNQVAFNASATDAHRFASPLSIAILSESDHMQAMPEDLSEAEVFDATAYSVGVNASGVNIFAASIEGETIQGQADKRVQGGIYFADRRYNGNKLIVAGATITDADIGSDVNKQLYTIFAHYKNNLGNHSEVSLGAEYQYNETEFNTANDIVELEVEGVSAYLQGKANLGTYSVPVNLVGYVQGRSTETTETTTALSSDDSIKRTRWNAGVGVETGYVKGDFSAIAGAGYAYTEINDRNEELAHVATSPAFDHKDVDDHGAYAFAKLTYKF